jgi:hypothetical protein
MTSREAAKIIGAAVARAILPPEDEENVLGWWRL